MTEQHECEWGPWHPWCSTYRCIYPGCYKNMPSKEVAKRLNEYETLRGVDDGTEKCMACDSMVEQVWHVSDELWNGLSGYPDGNGLLCIRCFDRKAQKRGVHLYWACRPNLYPIYADILEGK